MIIEPKIRGFICVTAHPLGCAKNVQNQIDYVKSKGPISNGPKRALVLGASTGYGLASRIALAFGSNTATLGVFFERPSEKGKPASAGWYNTAAFTKTAKEAGLYAQNINGDAFSDAVRQQVIDTIKKDLGQVDLIVYSLAAPRRTDPKTGVTHKSVLKPVGQAYVNKTVDTDKGIVSEVSLPPATEQEVADTVAVMGGEDWELWINALNDAGVIAPGATSLAYSYIGPELTWPIYKNGSIGEAKKDLARAAKNIDAILKTNGYGRAFISVNKALVTQASSAIPVVPLYISILYKIMKAKGTHEGCIEQCQRLFAQKVYGGEGLEFDEEGRVRIDNLELEADTQEQVTALWPKVNTENLAELTDIAGYRQEFLKLFGFGLPGVDYSADVDPVVAID